LEAARSATTAQATTAPRAAEPWVSAFAAPPAWGRCASIIASRACGYSKGELSSISVGGRGATFNILVNRSGGPRSTVWLPSTGLSWSVEHATDRPAVLPAGAAAGLPNSRRLLVDGSLGSRTTGLLALIETQEAMEGYPLQAQRQDDAKRCIEAVQEALRLSADQRRRG